jgi:hypothetical protein
MKSDIPSNRAPGLAHLPRLVGALLWLFVFGLMPISSEHWPTWECNLPPAISATFACYTTLDV